ncbi:UrcA family protein [Altererythrobacter soli]|uniref:UrcA family protein n=1 Tax=Croceibacterium soli TaxID=1739690 RepID=A0A6I4UTP7_9SPHN|nr:UrcA family protein [Croceibacterium soli]MXP42282.1 UrcA family protein [Croceibacterium soli]
MRSLITVFTAAILANVAVPAMAQDERVVAVSLRDLNLATPEGRQVMERRIAAAVNTVCGEAYRGSVQQGRAVAECRERAAADAKRQANRAIAMAETVQVARAN